MTAFLQDLSFARFSCFRPKFHRSPEAMANQPNRREHRAQHRPASSKTAGLPSRRFSIPIEIPHGISASFVLLQDLSNELTFGEIGMIPLYVLTSDIHPEPQGLFHSVFH